MESLQEYMTEYKNQLGKGVIQKAYLGLMEYILDLRTHFNKKYPDFAPGNLYQGYMDMTYFPIFPAELTSRKLKIAIVFIHETFKFEAWLSAQNKQVQTNYWQMFKDSNWGKYRISSSVKGSDSIVKHILVENPDFKNLDALTAQIEKGTLTFINDIEGFLYKHQS